MDGVLYQTMKEIIHEGLRRASNANRDWTIAQSQTSSTIRKPPASLRKIGSHRLRKNLANRTPQKASSQEAVAES